MDKKGVTEVVGNLAAVALKSLKKDGVQLAEGVQEFRFVMRCMNLMTTSAAKAGHIELLPPRYRDCDKCWHAEVDADQMPLWVKAMRSLSQSGMIRRVLGDHVKVIFTGQWQDRGDEARRRVFQIWRGHRSIQAYWRTIVLQGLGNINHVFKPRYEDETRPEMKKWTVRDSLMRVGVKTDGCVPDDFGQQLFTQSVNCSDGIMCAYYNDSKGETVSGLRRTKDGAFTETAEEWSNCPGLYFAFHIREVLKFDEKTCRDAMFTMDDFTKMAIPLMSKCEFNVDTRKVIFNKLSEKMKLRRGTEEIHKTITDCGAKIVFFDKKDFEDSSNGSTSAVLSDSKWRRTQRTLRTTRAVNRTYR